MDEVYALLESCEQLASDLRSRRRNGDPDVPLFRRLQNNLLTALDKVGELQLTHGSVPSQRAEGSSTSSFSGAATTPTPPTAGISRLRRSPLVAVDTDDVDAKRRRTDDPLRYEGPTVPAAPYSSGFSDSPTISEAIVCAPLTPHTPAAASTGAVGNTSAGTGTNTNNASGSSARNNSTKKEYMAVDLEDLWTVFQECIIRIYPHRSGLRAQALLSVIVLNWGLEVASVPTSYASVLCAAKSALDSFPCPPTLRESPQHLPQILAALKPRAVTLLRQLEVKETSGVVITSSAEFLQSGPASISRIQAETLCLRSRRYIDTALSKLFPFRPSKSSSSYVLLFDSLVVHWGFQEQTRMQRAKGLITSLLARYKRYLEGRTLPDGAGVKKEAVSGDFNDTEGDGNESDDSEATIPDPETHQRASSASPSLFDPSFPLSSADVAQDFSRVDLGLQKPPELTIEMFASEEVYNALRRRACTVCKELLKKETEKNAAST